MPVFAVRSFLSASGCIAQARDDLRNKRLCGGDTFLVRLEGPQELTARVTDHDNGTYTVEYTATAAGRYQLSIVNGVRARPCMP